MNKKGSFQITDVANLAVILAVIAIVLGIMASVLVTMQESSDDETGWRTVVNVFDSNETFTALNETAITLDDHADSEDFVAGSCTNVIIRNGTTVDEVTASFSVSGCEITLVGVIALNNTVMTANYTYQAYEYGAPYNITQQGVNATEDFSAWQGTFAVLIAAAVVIGIVGIYLFLRPRG